MINSGWSTPTPWHTHREESEDQLKQRIQVMIDKLKDVKNSIFNLHDPPYGSGLDSAPELTSDMRLAYAGQSLVPVGSKAVLELIEQYGPLLTLHGHIHEGKGTRKYRNTLCINTGSMYEQGMLQGAVVELKSNKVGNYLLTTG
jgi:Icc-related predicted phosphoesterase